MLAEKFTADTALPFPGSTGYLRGTADKVRVLRHNAADATCLVQLFRRNLATWEWEPVPGSSGNREVPTGDIYADQREASFCGKAPKKRAPRKPRGLG